MPARRCSIICGDARDDVFSFGRQQQIVQTPARHTDISGSAIKTGIDKPITGKIRVNRKSHQTTLARILNIWNRFYKLRLAVPEVLYLSTPFRKQQFATGQKRDIPNKS